MNAKTHVPTVSIGLAVRNGMPYLVEALDSILAQTYTDFELIISDNASTDETEDVCRRYAARDPRIRYYRNATNIGGANNENLTFRLSRGKYFRWAAHDDVLAPTLLERCVEVLDREPDVVLCHTGVIEIDADGRPTGQFLRSKGASSNPARRFKALALSRDSLEESYGLMRSSVLASTRLQLNYTNSDRTLMCELSLKGRFTEVPEFLFFKRKHAANEYLDWRTRRAWFFPRDRGKISLPYWIQFWDYLVTVHRSNLPTRTRAICYFTVIGPWSISHIRNLAKDVAVAMYMLVHSQEWRERRYIETENWS